MDRIPVINREIAWLEFNARVLAEARKKDTPLLERLKFLGIVSSNFDEFFMVRVAALKSAIRKGESSFDSSGVEPAKILGQVSSRVKEIVSSQYSCLMSEILPDLAAEGFEIVPPSGWTIQEKRFLDLYFGTQVFPLVTPLRIEVDSFPSTGNLQIHAAFALRSPSGERLYALAQSPRTLSRFIALPMDDDSPAPGLRHALLEDLLVAFASRLFPGHAVDSALVFKVTRDADSGVDEDREEDFLSAMEEVLAGRQNSFPVRLGCSGDSPELLKVLQKGLDLGEADTYNLPGPIDLAGFYELAALWDKETERSGSNAGSGSRLKDKTWPPLSIPQAEGSSIWEEIDAKDRLLQVPYESFQPIQRFIDEAADDPSVLSIKMTLYRTSGDSSIVKALIRAARNRKQVAVVVELKARFDEERNIGWASTLEQSGAIVTYGVARLKVHAKAALVVRRAKDGTIRKYLHLSTGNYNEKTARQYSDVSLFTADEDMCRDASAFFNMLTGYSTAQRLSRLSVAPFDMKKQLLSLVEREIQRSSAEAPGLIMAKLNALTDSDMIDALYRASRAGVRIMLNVRGACTCIPGIPGRSDTIEVRSVLGRYLEHARILLFGNGGHAEVYLASADWLPRNLDRRVELMFPVLDEQLVRECTEILETYFRDNEHSYRMRSDGTWEAVRRQEGEKRVYAQDQLYRRLRRKVEIAEAIPEQLTVRRRFKTE